MSGVGGAVREREPHLCLPLLLPFNPALPRAPLLHTSMVSPDQVPLEPRAAPFWVLLCSSTWQGGHSSRGASPAPPPHPLQCPQALLAGLEATDSTASMSQLLPSTIRRHHTGARRAVREELGAGTPGAAAEQPWAWQPRALGGRAWQSLAEPGRANRAALGLARPLHALWLG